MQFNLTEHFNVIISDTMVLVLIHREGGVWTLISGTVVYHLHLITCFQIGDLAIKFSCLGCTDTWHTNHHNDMTPCRTQTHKDSICCCCEKVHCSFSECQDGFFHLDHGLHTMSPLVVCNFIYHSIHIVALFQFAWHVQVALLYQPGACTND